MRCSPNAQLTPLAQQCIVFLYVISHLWLNNAVFYYMQNHTACSTLLCCPICSYGVASSTEYYCSSKLQPTRCNVSWFVYFYRRYTCFRRFLRPSSGAHNCTHSFRYCLPILLLASTVAARSRIGWQYLKLYVQLCAPADGRGNRLKHVERL
jgi:hypothetical protein